MQARRQYKSLVSLTFMNYRFPAYPINVEIDPSKICRAVIGHLLSARISFNGPMMDEMRTYILDRNIILPSKYHIYSWVIPEEEYSVSVETCLVSPAMEIFCYDCYKVFPIGFIFTDFRLNIEGAIDLLRYNNGETISIEYNCQNHPSPNWPEQGLVLPPGYSRLLGANMYNALKYVKRN